VTIINLKRHIQKIKARCFATDPALKAVSDDELVQALREVSDDPADHALSDWFRAGCNGPPPSDAHDALQRSL
jgi:hypothetical protein